MNTKRLILFSISALGVFMLHTGTAQVADINPYGDDVRATSGKIDAPIPPHSQTITTIGDGILKVTAQWSVLPAASAAKYLHQGAFLNGNFYVFAGGDVNGNFSLTAYKYNVAGSTWSQIKNAPGNRVYGCAEAVNGKIYLIGGYRVANPYTNEANVVEYDPATDTYKTVTQIPTPVSGAATVVVNSMIYVIGGAGNGGFSSDFKNLVQVYDPAMNQWSVATSLPYSARTLAAGAVGNSIIVCGGFNGNYVSSAYRGDVSGNTIAWQKVADYPGGAVTRLCGGAASAKAIFTGGQLSSGAILNNTYAFDLASNAWQVQEEKPTAINNSMKLSFDGSDKLYIMGGATAAGVSNSLEAFSSQAPVNANLILTDKAVAVTFKNGSTQRTQSRVIYLRNTGGLQLTWSASANPSVPWLTLPQSNGTVLPSNTSAVQLNFNSSGMNVGTSSTTLILTTNDPAKQTVNIPVSLFVQEQEIDTDLTVLLEEGTGTWCQYCPAGADSVRATLERYPGRVVAIAYHGGSANEPMLTPTTITWTQQVGLIGWPSAAVNRIKFPGEANISFVNRAQYATRTGEVLATRRSPASLKIVSKQYNPSTKQGSLTIEVYFHQAMDKPVRLNLAQLEDGLNWGQVNNTTPTYIYPYFHKHVLRQMLPNDFGEIVTTSNITNPQTAISKTISFVSKDSLPANSSFIVIAHISNGVSFGEVLQSKSFSLNSLTDVSSQATPTDFALSQNFPNPFNPTTTISYSLPKSSHVTLLVTDALGREIQTIVNETKEAGVHYAAFDASEVPSGVYLYTINAGSFTETKKMVVIK